MLHINVRRHTEYVEAVTLYDRQGYAGHAVCADGLLILNGIEFTPEQVRILHEVTRRFLENGSLYRAPESKEE